MPRRRSVSLEPEELSTASPRRSTRLSRVHVDSPLIAPKLEPIEEKKSTPARRVGRSMSAQVEGTQTVFEEKDVDQKPTRRSIRISVKQDDKIGLTTPSDKTIETETQKDTERLRRTTRSMSKSPTAPVTTGRVTPTTAKKQAAKRRLSAIEKITEDNKENVLEAISETEEIQTKTENLPEANNNIKYKNNENEITDGETTDQEKENTNQNANSTTPKKPKKSISKTPRSNRKTTLSVTEELVQEKLNEETFRLHISDDEQIPDISKEKTPKRVSSPPKVDIKKEETSHDAKVEKIIITEQSSLKTKNTSEQVDTKEVEIFQGDTVPQEDQTIASTKKSSPRIKKSPTKMEENIPKLIANSPERGTKEEETFEAENEEIIEKSATKSPKLGSKRTSISTGEEIEGPNDQQEPKLALESLEKIAEKIVQVAQVTKSAEIVQEIDNILVSIECKQKSPVTKRTSKDSKNKKSEKNDIIASLLEEVKKEIDIEEPKVLELEKNDKKEVKSSEEHVEKTSSSKKEIVDNNLKESNEEVLKTSSLSPKKSQFSPKDNVGSSPNKSNPKLDEDVKENLKVDEKPSSETHIIAVHLEGLDNEEKEKESSSNMPSLLENTPVDKPEGHEVSEKGSKASETIEVKVKEQDLEDKNTAEEIQEVQNKDEEAAPIEKQNVTKNEDKLVEEKEEDKVFKDNLQNEEEFESNISIVGSESPNSKEIFSTDKRIAVETNEEEQEINLSMVNDDGKSYSPIHNTYDISSPMDKKLDELINRSNFKRKDSKQSSEKKKLMAENEESSSSEEVDEEERDVVSRKRRWERNSQFQDSPAIKKKRLIEKPKQPFSDEEEKDDIWTDCSDETSSDDDNFIANEFVDDQAMEGEEDTPSEDSNQIIDEGESIGSTTDDESLSDEQSLEDFVVNDDDVEDSLLSGEENFLESPNKEGRISWSGGKKKKTKCIIEICSDDENPDNEGSFDNLSVKPNQNYISVQDSVNDSIDKKNKKLSEMIENNEKVNSDQEIETINLDSDEESETKNLAKALNVEKESADIIKDFCDLEACKTTKTKEQIENENALALKEIEKEIAELKKLKSHDTSVEIAEPKIESTKELNVSKQEKIKGTKKKHNKPQKIDASPNLGDPIDLEDESRTLGENKLSESVASGANTDPISDSQSSISAKKSKKLDKSLNLDDKTPVRAQKFPIVGVIQSPNSEEMETAKSQSNVPMSKSPNKRKSTTSSEGSPEKISKLDSDIQENKKKKSKKNRKSIVEQEERLEVQESSDEIPELVEMKKTPEKWERSFKKPISAFKEKSKKMKQSLDSEEERRIDVEGILGSSGEKKKSRKSVQNLEIEAEDQNVQTKTRTSSISDNWVEEKVETIPIPDKTTKLSPVALKSSSKKKLKSRKTTSGDWIEDSLLDIECTPKSTEDNHEDVFEEKTLVEVKKGEKPVLYSFQSVEDESPSIFKDNMKLTIKNPEDFEKSPCAHLLKLSRDTSIEIKSCEKPKMQKKHSQFTSDPEDDIFQDGELKTADTGPKENINSRTNSGEKKKKKKSKKNSRKSSESDLEKQDGENKTADLSPKETISKKHDSPIPESSVAKKRSKKNRTTSQDSSGHFDSGKQNDGQDGGSKTADSLNKETEHLVITKKKFKKDRNQSDDFVSLFVLKQNGSQNDGQDKKKKKSPKQEQEERLSVKALVKKYELLSPKPVKKVISSNKAALFFKIEKSKNEKASINELNDPTPTKPISIRGFLKPDLHGSTNCPKMKIEIVDNISNLSKKIKKRERKLKYQSNNNASLSRKVEIISGQKTTNFKTEFLFGNNVKRIDSQQLLQMKQKKKFLL